MNKISQIFKTRIALILFLIFLAAVVIRFLYFPGNIYFGFDQARDAYISQEILQGELKIVGPTTSIVGLNHGAFFYYLFAPIYFLSQGDPTGLSIFIRIYNALGIVLVFFVARNLFIKQRSANLIGIFASLLFAFSYEQTQYALYMTHPTFAILTSLLFYLGLTLLLFRGKSIGLPLALLGAGLSFQFHFLQAVLFLILVINLGVFGRRIPKINLKVMGLSIFGLLFSLSTFIVAEIRFKFQGISNLLNSAGGQATGGSEYGFYFNSGLNAGLRFIADNLFAFFGAQLFVLILLLIACGFYLKNKETRDQIIFLLIWLVVGLLFYFISDTSLYFYAAGTSMSLIVLAGFLIGKIFEKNKFVGVAIFLLIISSNIYMIIINNPMGPNKEINVQTGMLLTDEQRAVDFIYEKANGELFAVNAFTMPIYINTTWDYLFENYGKRKYGYTPIWGGKAADGYPGFLIKNNARTTLPNKRFLIIEPTRDAVDHLKDFEVEEGYFTNNIEEQSFGDIKVYLQAPK